MAPISFINNRESEERKRESREAESGFHSYKKSARRKVEEKKGKKVSLSPLFIVALLFNARNDDARATLDTRFSRGERSTVLNCTQVS